MAKQAAQAIPEESTALVVPSNGGTGLPALSDGLENYTGFEGIDSSLFIIPRISIVQPTSKIVGATPGNFRINLTGEEFNELRAVVIKSDMGRVWRSEDLTEKKPLCRSFDGMVPDPAMVNAPSPMCRKKGIVNGKPGLIAVCPKAEWGKDEKGEPVRPQCDETLNLLCISITDMLPFWFTVHGLGLKPTLGYLSAIALRRSALWKFTTTITLKETIVPKGKAFVPEFTRPTALEVTVSPYDISTLIGMVQGLIGESVKTTFDAEEAAGEATDMGDEPPPPDAPSWM